MRGERVPPPDEQGFSLVEVLVALALIATTTAALGPFFVNSLLTVAQQRGKQAAVELANGAVEQVRALRGSSLVTGRSRLRSTEQWQDAYDHGPAALRLYLAPPGRPVTGPTTMRLAWDTEITDPASTLGDDAAISTATQTMTVDKTAYSRTVYVGECDIYLGGSGKCVNPDVVTPPSDATRDLKFFRVVVLVSWPDRRCAAGTCDYLTSTLIARAAEPIFDVHRPAPVVKTGTVTLYRGVAAAYQLEATGGQLPNTWTIGALPAGLTMTPAGVVGGTPTALGTATTTATVTDKLGRSDSETVTFKVVLPLAVTVPGDAREHVGEAVSRQVTAAGGVPPYTYTATGLPAGLTLDFHAGAITGTLTTAGTYPVSVTATDANGGTATGSYTHTVQPALRLGVLADLSVTLGSAVAATAVAQGGDGTYTYSASGLPPGVLLDAGTGVLSGISTDSGRYLATVVVTDGLGGTATGTFVLIVTTSSSLVFTSPGLAAADRTSPVGVALSLAVATNADALDLKPKIDDTGLPAGLKLNPGRDVIGGTPTTVGTYLVTLVASDAKTGQTSTLTFVWTIR